MLKIKQIWLKYRKTLDAVRQHGGSGVVTTFYVCNEIWSESPAAESTETGLESVLSLRIRKQILYKKFPKMIVIRNSDKKKLLLRPCAFQHLLYKLISTLSAINFFKIANLLRRNVINFEKSQKQKI